MSIVELSVKRPITILMVFLLITVFGVITLQMLPIEMMPNISLGYITININIRGGIPAAKVEKKVSRPVEEAVSSVSHLKTLLSISKEGNARIILEFEPGTDMDFAALETRENFSRIRNKLPKEIEKPIIAKYQYTDTPIMILAVTSQQRTPEELRKIVDDKIKDRVQRIEGIAQVEVVGGRESKILIEVDQSRLQSYALPIGKLVDIININNINLMVGEINKVRDKYLIRTIGEFESLEDIENLAVAVTQKGSIIRIKDVADVKDSYLDPVAFARVNAQPAVSLYIQKESLANTVNTSRLIDKELKFLTRVLPEDVKIVPTFNQAEYIVGAVNRVKFALLYGAILASLILFVFLRNPRSILIIISSIPLSLMVAFSLMFFSKISLNIMSLSGLAIGVGMLVDSSIVVIENIFKKRDALQGSLDPQIMKSVSTEGTNEMALPIFASTLTTLSVFIPLIFINPETKMLYSGVANTICFSLMASLVVSLTLIPMLCSRIIQRPTPPEPQPPAFEEKIELKPPEENAPAPEKKQTIKLWFFSLFAKIRDWYDKALYASVNMRYILLLITLFIFSVAVWQGLKLDKEFIGVAEQNKFTIFVEMPTGTRLDISDEIVYKVEKFAAGVEEVKTVTTKVEPWSSKVYIELYPLNIRKISSQEVIEKIRPYTETLEPAFIYFEESEEVGTKEILIELFGYDYEVLKNLAIAAASRMKGIPKFTDLKIRMREGRPEMWVSVNKPQAALLGLTAGDISLTLHTQMRGLVATRYRGMREPLIRAKDSFRSNYSTSSLADNIIFGDEAKDVEEVSKFAPYTGDEKEIESIVRLEEKFRKTFEDLKRLSIITPEGDIVYLSQFADFTFDFGPSEIWRKDKSRMVQVSANTGGMPLGKAAEYVKTALKDMEMPKDYFWQFGGDYHKMMRNQKDMIYILLSVVLVYMILASLFESFMQPFIILTTVPLAAIGAIFLLRLTGKSISIGVLIGAMLLAGIVVNNGIILIDRINVIKKRSRGSDPKEVAKKACQERTRPIFMTSLTTILGLLPLAIDRSESANLWSPLAITVIGGLCVSTALMLFVVPGVYLILSEDLNLFRKE
ncbi:MAG: efflux RND transporter permease subunit [Candidatus Omnitrophica bacterium]|nr:efflux RND transporter permease subunit [Candidatus Omnitrophota bacterium]